MRAVTIVDGDLRYLEHPDPVPGDTELVVAVRAAGINNADLMQRLGLYPAPAGLAPRHPGHGARRGGGRHGQVAPRASPSAIVSWPWWAAVPRPSCAPWTRRAAMAVPPDVPWPEAGGFPEAFSTAYDALFTQCGLGPGERVLVTGAAGGVGQRRGAAGRGDRGPLRGLGAPRPVARRGGHPGGARRRSRRGARPRPLRRRPRARGGGQPPRGARGHGRSADASRSSAWVAGRVSRSTCWR